MIEYVLSLGWVAIGSCGCRDNKIKYSNVSIPNVEIWIKPAGDYMEIRRRWNARDSKVIASAGPSNYLHVYDYWIINNHIR